MSKPLAPIAPTNPLAEIHEGPPRRFNPLGAYQTLESLASACASTEALVAPVVEAEDLDLDLDCNLLRNWKGQGTQLSPEREEQVELLLELINGGASRSLIRQAINPLRAEKEG